jgi:hypothetical protein
MFLFGPALELCSSTRPQKVKNLLNTQINENTDLQVSGTGRFPRYPLIMSGHPPSTHVNRDTGTNDLTGLKVTLYSISEQSSLKQKELLADTK